MMENLLFIIMTILYTYLFYQLIRNKLIYDIRVKWVYSGDSRWYKYSYKKMFLPSKDNWFGIKLPKDKHYKKDSKLKNETFI